MHEHIYSFFSKLLPVYQFTIFFLQYLQNGVSPFSLSDFFFSFSWFVFLFFIWICGQYLIQHFCCHDYKVFEFKYKLKYGVYVYPTEVKESFISWETINATHYILIASFIRYSDLLWLYLSVLFASLCIYLQYVIMFVYKCFCFFIDISFA